MISPRGSNLELITAPSQSSAKSSQLIRLQALLSDTCSMRRAPRISSNDDDVYMMIGPNDVYMISLALMMTSDRQLAVKLA